MAVTQNQYTGNGSTVLFSFTFPYLASTDVKVKVDGTDTTAFTLANATTVQMNAAPANGAVVVVYRNTDNDNKKATFYPGSAIKAEDLNNDFDQILYVAQEVDNNALDSLGTSPMQANLSMGNNKLTNLATPTAGTDATNKTYVDTQNALGVDSAVAAGTDLSKSTSSGVTTFAHNVTGANQTVNNSNGTVLQDITITAQGHVTSAGSTDLDNRYYTKTTLDGGHFDGRYYTETELNAGQLNNQYYTETELDAGQLDNRYYTETELNAGQLDNRYYTEAELNAGQLDTRYFRQDSSETISQGDTWSGNDNYIATTAAIDARITDLVEEVGGFVPIANETSFPTSNPDINNGAGTLISIKAMSSSRTPSGGVVTISDGAGSGVTVTINGCGTTVLTAGYGVILETTSTTHTYNFHRLSPSTLSITTVSNNISNINAVAANETNINAVNNNSTNINAVANNNANITSVAGNATNINAVAPNVSNISAVNANATNINTVAGNNTNINTVATNAASVSTVATNISSVNNFADRYRVASSAPSSSLDVGDLYFDTTGNELKVYNGSAWQGGVTATGNLVSKSGDEFTGNITFSGSQTVDGRDLSVDGAKLDGIAISANNYAISSDLLDQDDMVANSATKVPSQQSVKAYVDNQTLSLIDEDDMSTDSATRPPSQQSVKAYADTKAPKASPAFTGTATGVNLTLSGDLTVNGTTTTLNSTTVSIDDKNLELGKVATPTDTTADGGGITLKGGTDKTFNWVNSTDAWTSSEHIHLGDNKKLLVGNGSDLQIYHDGSHSYVKDAGTGNLILAGTQVNILNAAANESMIRAAENGAVELYYDNSKKLETASWGVRVTGWLGLLDSQKAVFGDGDDLQIYHDGTSSIIDNNTGDLFIKTTGSGDDILLDSNDDIFLRVAGTESGIEIVGDGAVNLYYDNAKKFETTSAGATVTGSISTNTGGGAAQLGTHLDLGDNQKARFGGGDDLQIYHDGSNSYIKDAGSGILILDASQVQINNAGSTENLAKFIPDGAVELYYDNSKRLATTSSGVDISGGSVNTVKITGTSGHELYSYSDSGGVGWCTGAGAGNYGELIYFDENTGDIVLIAENETSAKFKGNGAVELYYDGVKKLETKSWGVEWTGDLENNSDSSRIKMGASDDLQIYHDGSNSYIDDAGELRIKGAYIKLRGTNDEDGLIFTQNGSIQLKYNNSLKLETTSTGVTVTGTVSDSKGNLRSIPQNAQTGSGGNYVCVASDAGKHILRSGNGVNFPSNVFAAGDAITVINNSASDMNMVPGSGVTLYNTADGQTGQRVLAARGMCTVIYASSGANVDAYISGAGLS